MKHVGNLVALMKHNGTPIG